MKTHYLNSARAALVAASILAADLVSNAAETNASEKLTGSVSNPITPPPPGPNQVLTPAAPNLSLPHLQPKKKIERMAAPGQSPEFRDPMLARPTPADPNQPRAGRPGPRDPRADVLAADPGVVRADPNRREATLSTPPPRNVPPAVLKKYDVNKDGKLDSVELYAFRKDTADRQAELLRLRSMTNTIPSEHRSSSNSSAVKP
jgi:hypothetical protein